MIYSRKIKWKLLLSITGNEYQKTLFRTGIKASPGIGQRKTEKRTLFWKMQLLQMRECVNSENVGQVEELLLMTEQMQDELDQKDETIMERNRQLSRLLSLNEKLNSENRAENIEALRTRLRQTEQQLTSETDSRKRADTEVVAWKFKYEKVEQAKRYVQTHQKMVEVPVEKKVPYEK